MESILVNSVHKSLQHFMLRNAIFVCERLCAEFSSEMNLQLLAGCYLQNNQAYAAYHILKGTRMDQSRYLFALACFQMDLLSEAETALSPAHESGLEVPNSAAAHCLLGFIYSDAMVFEDELIPCIPDKVDGRRVDGIGFAAELKEEGGGEKQSEASKSNL
ncbi:hypothetical protein Cgig2_005561 [Carnegiea gigantea]|uniref:Uncharacterized protein n=1 Tax=Carnegiea gigantea TaxID=171969 RepID=A0A9Q1KTT5_9CARY|nr:hypothetical protein Cgig2_005561 [Carnegiea gigantea]